MKLPTTILAMQCPQGHRRDCRNKGTCMYRHIGERVGEPLKDVINNEKRIRSYENLSPLKRAKMAIDRTERTAREEDGPSNRDFLFDVPEQANITDGRTKDEANWEENHMDLPYNIPGLKNIDGSSCYVNAVIQALTSLHPLTQELLQLKPTQDQQITTELWNIITEITSGRC